MLFRSLGAFFLLSFFALINFSVFANQHTQKEFSPAQQLEYENKKALALASIAKVFTLLESQYIDPELIDVDQMAEKALKAVIAGLDPHTAYLTPDQFRRFVNIEPNPQKIKSSVELHDLSHDIAYVKLSIFNSSSYNDVYNNLSSYKTSHSNKIRGLVLDLRDNPGGLFDQSIQIANLFVESGILVSTIGRDSDRPQQVEYALKNKTFEQFPMIVLVNENTASSSEIVAGALQDRDRALIMGSTTYGKGSVQKVVPLANGGAIKFTVARYYTPSGRSLQAEGVIPDVMFIPHGESKYSHRLQNKRLKIAVQQKSVYDEIDNWNKNLQKDEILKQAYLYLRQSL